jgi:hypothetical protein
MEKLPGRDLWAVIDTVTHRPALVNDVPQIDLELDDADDLTDLLNRLEQEAAARVVTNTDADAGSTSGE